MLATCLHMMQGTPYVYQGEELGMTNCPFGSLADLRDIESINAFHEMTEAGKIAPDDMMRYIRLRGRDNARTPMQWDDGENAGFTTGTPWIMVNPNYEEVNAKKELADPDSVFHYYKKLIALRKREKIMVYGSYELLEPESESLYVYTRTLKGEPLPGAEDAGEKLLVICNFTEMEEAYSVPEEFAAAKVLISNYVRDQAKGTICLKPYEAIVLKSGR